ncbi:YjbH domain-containing protein [Amylibacter marinus]|nr:YjbH domain-containing protein [Amylibacter marinus]
MHIISTRLAGVLASCSALCLATPITAQTLGFGASTNHYGGTGLIDMPTAESQPDGELSVTMAGFAGTTRGAFAFQILPRLSGTFRYTRLANWIQGGDTYDRSFDMQYRLLDEAKYRPAVAIGLRDFLGTGIYSGQYLVGTKNIGTKLKVTAGLGWGRFSNSDEFQRDTSGNPGGTLLYREWFTGPVGGFAGIEWQTPVKNLRLKAEYSSDSYIRENRIAGERTEATFERKSSLNFGLEYDTKWGVTLGAYHMYGSELGFSVRTSLNPHRGRGIAERAPRPIAVRGPDIDRDTSWTKINGISQTARKQLDKILNRDGMALEGLYFSGETAEIRVRNSRYVSTAQAVGRSARAMARVFPDSVEKFIVVPMVDGLATAAFHIERSDLEEFENHPNAARMMAGRVEINDARLLESGEGAVSGLYPAFNWSLAPFVSVRIFDASNPFAVSAGIRLSGAYQPRAGLTFAGSIVKNLKHDDVSFDDVVSDGLHRVRTDSGRYNAEGDPSLERLTGEYLFKVRPDTYGRVTVGYLEKMYGGVSGEILWKPADSKWGFGAELNYVKQRDFDQRFGFQDYDVVTGHVSAYLDLPRGFVAQLDVGQYLAGDKGGTISLHRTFGNGWKVGAYATLTDVPFEEYGEGSFDKGLSLTIPLGWVTGQQNRRSIENTLASLTRDGGARLRVQNRLYGLVENSHATAASASWARFWK